MDRWNNLFNITFAPALRNRVRKIIEFDINWGPLRQMTKSRSSGQPIGHFLGHIFAAIQKHSSQEFFFFKSIN